MNENGNCDVARTIQVRLNSNDSSVSHGCPQDFETPYTNFAQTCKNICIFLIWITSLSKKNYNLENHILEIQGDPQLNEENNSNPKAETVPCGYFSMMQLTCLCGWSELRAKVHDQLTLIQKIQLTGASLTQFTIDNMPTVQLLQPSPRNPTTGQYKSVEA